VVGSRPDTLAVARPDLEDGRGPAFGEQPDRSLHLLSCGDERSFRFELATQPLDSHRPAVCQLDPRRSWDTVDIVANRARADTPVLGIDTGYPTHGKPVALMAVWHAESVGLYPRQLGRVPELVERLVLRDLLQQRSAREHSSGDTHVAALGYLPHVVADAMERELASIEAL